MKLVCFSSSCTYRSRHSLKECASLAARISTRRLVAIRQMERAFRGTDEPVSDEMFCDHVFYVKKKKRFGKLLRPSRSLLNERTMENGLRMASVLVSMFNFLRDVNSNCPVIQDLKKGCINDHQELYARLHRSHSLRWSGMGHLITSIPAAILFQSWSLAIALKTLCQQETRGSKNICKYVVHQYILYSILFLKKSSTSI